MYLLLNLHILESVVNVKLLKVMFNGLNHGKLEQNYVNLLIMYSLCIAII